MIASNNGYGRNMRYANDSLSYHNSRYAIASKKDRALSIEYLLLKSDFCILSPMNICNGKISNFIQKCRKLPFNKIQQFHGN